MHICKPPQGFAFGIRKEFGPPRSRSVPSREIFWAASRLPDSARQRTPARSPSAAATRLLHRAASSSLGFFIARQLPSPPPHNIFIATQVFVRPLPPSAAASPRYSSSVPVCLHGFQSSPGRFLYFGRHCF